MKTAQLFFRVVTRDSLLLTCSLLIVAVVLLATIGINFTGYNYEQISDASLLEPSWSHWCGTDINGRDLLTRILYGAQISLLVAALGGIISLMVGATYGMVSGYFGGMIDNFMMRFVDVIYSLPRVVLVVILITASENGFRTFCYWAGWSHFLAEPRVILLIFFLGLTEWMTMARIVRGQVLVLREQQFVQASLALGQSHVRIIFHHLLPNLTGLILVYLMLTIPSVMLDESFLSFLGLGVQAPLASWGTLISDAAFLINPIKLYWWMLFFPGGMMILTLLSLNFLGDGLRDVFDPRVKK